MAAQNNQRVVKRGIGHLTGERRVVSNNVVLRPLTNYRAGEVVIFSENLYLQRKTHKFAGCSIMHASILIHLGSCVVFPRASVALRANRGY